MARRRHQSGLGRFFGWLFGELEPAPAPRRRARSTASARSSAPSGDVADRLRRGAVTPDELDRLLASGQVRFRRNPMLTGALTLAHHRRPSNPACPGLTEAERQAMTFHGTPVPGTALCFHGRPHVVLGRAEAIEYAPPPRSRRGDAVWRHEFGDQGEGRPRRKGRPLVVAEPDGTVELVGGPARFRPEAGIVG